MSADVAVRPLRDWQRQAIDDLRGSLRSGHKHVVLQSPTGTGKTKLSAAIIDMARDKGKRVVFCVPSISLVDQSVSALWADGIRDVGVIQASHAQTDWSRPTQVASIQTLQRRPDPEADLVIVDECHIRSKHVEAWMARTKVPFIGLSATPWTRGLGAPGLYDDLIVAMTTQTAIDDGLLTPFRVYGPDKPSTEGIKVVAGDYVEKQASERMQEKKLVASIVETWTKLGKGLPTLAFCVDRAHAKKVQDEFLQAGILCGYQDAFTEPAERRQIKEAFHRGTMPIVASVGTLILGVDWDVRCIIWARLTKSKILFCQGIGRGLRLAEGKSSLLILDHAGTHDKLGYVTDIHREHLHDGKAVEGEADPNKEPLPKTCPQCSFVRPPRVPKCPNCGFEAKAPASKVQTVAGELVEKTPEEGGGKYTKIQRERQRTKAIKLNGVPVPLRSFYSELQGYAAAHGYRPGWASNKYREAIGVWPNAHKSAPTLPPSPEVSSWCRARAIAYAKAREKTGARNAAD